MRRAQRAFPMRTAESGHCSRYCLQPWTSCGASSLGTRAKPRPAKNLSASIVSKYSESNPSCRAYCAMCSVSLRARPWPRRTGITTTERSNADEPRGSIPAMAMICWPSSSTWKCVIPSATPPSGRLSAASIACMAGRSSLVAARMCTGRSMICPARLMASLCTNSATAEDKGLQHFRRETRKI